MGSQESGFVGLGISRDLWIYIYIYIYIYIIHTTYLCRCNVGLYRDLCIYICIHMLSFPNRGM